jgi:sugar/nucleoside kinase (ribokinase family)
MTIDFLAFSIIIDDIVFPDGRTEMGVLGGGGPQTAFGMKLWADGVGMTGAVGYDFPADAQAWLDEMGIDDQGLYRSPDLPTLRAWQIYDEEGRRAQVWRHKELRAGIQLRIAFDQLPASYQQAKGFHLGIHPENPALDLIHELRDHGVTVSVETFKDADRLLTDDELRALASAGHIFSPNLHEARTMTGLREPDDLLRKLADAGAEVIILRLAEEGSIVYHGETGERWHIPAVETAVVDPTGAGNAYCGAFLAGWVTTGDLRTAGLYGAVAASFLVEQVGLPRPRAGLREEARRRLAALRERAM